VRTSGLLGIVAIAACTASPAPIAPDAPAMAPAPGDGGAPLTACGAFEAEGVPVPMHVTGTLAGNSTVQSPSTCAVTNAPYGTESAGPDQVVLVDGLVPGTSYVVRLSSDDDLLFYVATGCAGGAGPTTEQCLLFQDATTSGAEVGTFVAPGPSVYVIVDTYASLPPTGGQFALDVYAQGCTTNADCTASDPVCTSGACVQCATSFDCTDPSAPQCSDNTCVSGSSGCTSDDPAEPGDDGPAGATVLTSGTPVDAHVCSKPSTEGDFYAFDVTDAGDTWDLTLAWSGTRDLDLELYSATGELYGLSYWQQPEHVQLTYLAPGRYYAFVREYSPGPDSVPQPYTIAATRTPGAPCQTSRDCAAAFENQLYRGSCTAGSCVDLQGSGSVGAGGACDRQSDCAAGLDCPSFFFTEDADTRDVCEPTCTSDAQCRAGFVCTTYLQQNFCALRCTDDLDCPVVTGTQPTSGPWARLSCQVATGRCLP
jgi:hypothetical protein